MRRFTDPDGNQWDAAIGRESWGTFVILFTPRSGGGIRKTTIAAETMLDAQQEMDGLADAELHQHLARSQPWE